MIIENFFEGVLKTVSLGVVPMMMFIFNLFVNITYIYNCRISLQLIIKALCSFIITKLFRKVLEGKRILSVNSVQILGFHRAHV